MPAIGIGHLYPKAASIASSGFGLSALCVAAERGYLKEHDAEARMLAILDFFANRCPQVHGFFYHYIDVTNGTRIAKYELSSIDTSLLVCGVLHARRFLNSGKADALALTIYGRVDWNWMLNGGPTLAMGWMPESGFIPYRWENFCEATLMYLMAIGSPTHPIPAHNWNAIKRNLLDYGGIRFITSYGALFIHLSAYLGRFSRHSRPLHELLRELDRGYPRAQDLLHADARTMSLDGRERVGFWRIRITTAAAIRLGQDPPP